MAALGEHADDAVADGMLILSTGVVPLPGVFFGNYQTRFWGDESTSLSTSMRAVGFFRKAQGLLLIRKLPNTIKSWK